MVDLYLLYLGSGVVDPDAVAAMGSSVATDRLASFVSVDDLATSRDENKPPGGSEAQRDEVHGSKET